MDKEEIKNLDENTQYFPDELLPPDAKKILYLEEEVAKYQPSPQDYSIFDQKLKKRTRFLYDGDQKWEPEETAALVNFKKFLDSQ